MASYLRPRRGKEATAKSQNIILKKGEIFFEVPSTGVGKGIGRIKMGDGTTNYTNLPYFLQQRAATTGADVSALGITFTEATSTDNSTLLSAIKSGASVATLFGNIKKLLSNLNSSVTQLNNDLVNMNTTVAGKASSSHTHSYNSITDKPSKAYCWDDKEGGNIRVQSPAGINWEIDAYNGNLRIFTYENNVKTGIIIKTTGKVEFPNGNDSPDIKIQSATHSDITISTPTLLYDLMFNNKISNYSLIGFVSLNTGNGYIWPTYWYIVNTELHIILRAYSSGQKTNSLSATLLFKRSINP